MRQCEPQAGFDQGTAVRVRTGVMDPDFPGIHLGGWSGTIAEVRTEDAESYLIRWHPKTLVSVPRAIRDSCEKEDIAFDMMWLCEEDLEV